LAGTAKLSDIAQIFCQAVLSSSVQRFEDLVLRAGKSCFLAGTAKPLMPHLDKKSINTVNPSHHHTTS
jgi:hypothetical protein